MRGRSNVWPVVVAGVLALLFAWVSPAEAADPAIGVSPTPVSMEESGTPLFGTRSPERTAVGAIVVTNSGAAQDATLTAYLSDGTQITNVSPTTVHLPQTTPTAITVSLGRRATDLTSGWLVLSDSDTSAVVPFQLRITTPASVLVSMCWISGVIALAMVVGAIAWLHWWTKLGTDFNAGPTWKFQDSWASSLTAAGAVLGTILSASGFLAEVLPGISVGVFMGFSLLYGLLVLLAPIVYQACYSKEKSPRLFGLLIAGGIVLWAAMGELSTGLELARRGGMSLSAVVICFVVAGLALFFYGLTSFRAAIPDEDDLIDQAETATAAIATTVALSHAFGFSRKAARTRATLAAKDAMAVSRRVSAMAKRAQDRLRKAPVAPAGAAAPASVRGPAGVRVPVGGGVPVRRPTRQGAAML